MHLEIEIEKLKKKLLSLSAIVEDTVYHAVRALKERNAELARQVIDADYDTDEREVDIEEECQKILALHQPVANDLRHIIAVLKINAELERIGDATVNIGRLLFENNYIVISKNGIPRFKQYLDEMEGAPAQEIWDDIAVIGAQAKERLGYPTQKPEALLERIIKASSKKGDWVLDPFCGCGTTVAAAEKLMRNWVGVDITTLAINLIKHRLRNEFGLETKQINVEGVPTDLAGANELFKKDPFQFEYWAVDLVNARPAGSKSEGKMKGADKGIDGVMYFVKNAEEEYGKALVQVKGGGVK